MISRTMACSVLFVALHQMPGERSITAQVGSDDWTFEEWVGQSAVTGPLHPYVLTARGRTTDDAGAELTIRSTGQGVLTGQYSHGQARTTIRAAAVAGRRVTVSGVVDVEHAPEGASLWMRVNGTSGLLLVDFGGESRVRGDAVNQQRSIALPIPPDATTIDFGFRLRGPGTASVRILKLTAGPKLDADAPVNAEAKAVLDTAIGEIKTRALRRERVTAAVEGSARLLAAGAATSADTYPAIQYLIATLADGHSSFFSPAAWKMINGSDPAAAARNQDPDVRTTERIGYVEIPGYLGNQPPALRAYVTRVHRLLQDNRPNVACGWILDLRNNDGGNVFPMLAALQPFLGDGSLGADVGPDGPVEPRRAGRNVDVEAPSDLRALENAWTALLVGSRTNSAGESVTLAFRGRARTRVFGQPTAGRTTANTAITLPDGSGLALAVAVMADRTGRVYGGRIEPDELIPAQDPQGKSESDAALTAASEWLMRSSGCR